MLSFLFPPKCVLCRKLLTSKETDLCCSCRKNAPELPNTKRSIPFVAQWTAMWYYKDTVRKSIQRFKFYNCRSNAVSYGRLLSFKLLEKYPEAPDLITWVPISSLRHFSRGYDQAELLAKAISKELGVPVVSTLKKIRHTRPQSTILDSAQRRANVLGAYKVRNPNTIADKRVLLVDDVITTGATASECAKMLMTGGAEQVLFAAIAATSNDKKAGE